MKRPEKKEIEEGAATTLTGLAQEFKQKGYNQACDDHDPYIQSLKDTISMMQGQLQHHRDKPSLPSEEEIAKISCDNVHSGCRYSGVIQPCENCLLAATAIHKRIQGNEL